MAARQWRRFTVLTLAVVAVDLATKTWASRALRDRPVDLPGPLNLRLGHNRGIAFSSLTEVPVAALVTLTSVVVVALVIAVARGSAPMLPAGLVLGGAIGNLIDRTHNGTVVDMLHTSFWPTFNIADVAICVGAALWVLSSRPPSGVAREPDVAPTHSTSTDAR